MRLELRPGVKICESGTGSGSLSTSITKAIMPTGHLYTFEFNADRVTKAKTDFQVMGLAPYITVTHRDVLENGFMLSMDQPEGGAEGAEEELLGVTEGSMDAVFIDLP